MAILPLMQQKGNHLFIGSGSALRKLCRYRKLFMVRRICNKSSRMSGRHSAARFILLSDTFVLLPFLRGYAVPVCFYPGFPVLADIKNNYTDANVRSVFYVQLIWRYRIVLLRSGQWHRFRSCTQPVHRHAVLNLRSCFSLRCCAVGKVYAMEVSVMQP